MNGNTVSIILCNDEMSFFFFCIIYLCVILFYRQDDDDLNAHGSDRGDKGRCAHLQSLPQERTGRDSTRDWTLVISVLFFFIDFLLFSLYTFYVDLFGRLCVFL